MTSSAATPDSGSTWVQTGSLDFGRNLTGADRAYVKVSEVPDLKIPFPGLWEVAYSARTNLGVPAKVASLYATTAVFVNGALLPGTEAISGRYFNPNEAAQNTIGQTFLHKFAAGDVVTLHAYRIGQDGTVGILSNGDGRTRISAHWVSPGF